jgi:hypothetical protein
MSIRAKTSITAAAIATIFSLSACGGGGDAATPAAADMADTGGSAHAPGHPRLTSTGGDPASLVDNDTSSAADARPDARAAAPTVAVVSTGQVSLEADDVTKARREVQQVIDSYLGTVSEEEATTKDDGFAESTRVVIRIPSKYFAKTMKELEGVARLRSSTSNAEDVTTQVIDNDVRLRAQEKSLQRIEALLASAKNLSEVIAIESQLARRQADYDSLKSTQAWLKDQTTLSTITLSIRLAEKEASGKTGTGFIGGLDRGWDGLTDALVGLGTLLGLALPFTTALALLGLPMWFALRGVRRRRQAVGPDLAADQASG